MRPTPLDEALESLADALDQLPRLAPLDALGEAEGDHLAPSREAAERLQAELNAMSIGGVIPWWEVSEKRWFRNYFSFWRKPGATIPCELAVYEVEDGYGHETYDVSDVENPDADRATLVEGSKFRSDDDQNWRIRLGRTNWGFARNWATKNGDKLLNRGPREISVFGDPRCLPYPGIAGVHVIARTSDRYILCALREPHAKFAPLEWSFSFEESVAITQRRDTPDEPNGDKTVFDTVRHGFKEEFDVPADAVVASSCLSIGRHFDRPEEGLELSATIIVGVQLSLSLAEIWPCLDSAIDNAQDRSEHIAWAGIQFAEATQLARFLSSPRSYERGELDLLLAFAEAEKRCDVQLYPRAAKQGLIDNGLHLTSPARLLLGAQWFAHLDASL